MYVYIYMKTSMVHFTQVKLIEYTNRTKKRSFILD